MSDFSIDPNSEDSVILSQVVDYYNGALLRNEKALSFLKRKGIFSNELIARFKLGFAERSLGLSLPSKALKEGKELRSRLMQLGILRESGHEHFNGAVTFPFFDGEGRIAQIYGKKINTNLRPNTQFDLWLKEPNQTIFNKRCLFESDEVIVAQSMLDAFTFLANGFDNVICGDFDSLLALPEFQAKRLLTVYDRSLGNFVDDFQKRGVELFEITIPRGLSANAYAARNGDEAKEKLAALLSGASPFYEAEIPLPSALAAQAETEPPKVHVSPSSSEPEAVKKSESEVEFDENEARFTRGNRQYRIRGILKNTSFEVLKINLKLTCGELYHLDNIDLFQSSHRKRFIKDAAFETRNEPEVIKADIGKLLMNLEKYQEQRIKKLMEPEKVEVVISKADRESALQLLKAPDLLERVLADFDKCGVVGESTNKLIGYIASVSRKLDKPLGAIIQSTSAAGKTSLMEAILSFTPPEEMIKYSAMTGQSLYYFGRQEMKHKILAIAEEAGVNKASYALKLLQSEGELMIASTGKDQSGSIGTKSYHVEGPVMLFLTTTAIDIDEELMNRCLVLTVDECQKQTEAIHDLQRKAETIEGIIARKARNQLIHLHRNAQRLLEPLLVVNPYAKKLKFLNKQTRTRRDHVKYLTLIRAIALLHQHQREIKTFKHEGEELSYIEVESQDIEQANKLAQVIFERCLDEIPPQTRRVFDVICEMAKAFCKSKELPLEDFEFSRRDVRLQTGFSINQTKNHLDRLQDGEYIALKRSKQGNRFFYRLLYPDNGYIPFYDFLGSPSSGMSTT